MNPRASGKSPEGERKGADLSVELTTVCLKHCRNNVNMKDVLVS